MTQEQFESQVTKLNKVNKNLIQIAMEEAQKVGTLDHPTVQIYENMLHLGYKTICSTFVEYGGPRPIREGMEKQHARMILERNFKKINK
jgi:hypothetical protein